MQWRVHPHRKSRWVWTYLGPPWEAWCGCRLHACRRQSGRARAVRLPARLGAPTRPRAARGRSGGRRHPLTGELDLHQLFSDDPWPAQYLCSLGSFIRRLIHKDKPLDLPTLKTSRAIQFFHLALHLSINLQRHITSGIFVISQVS